MKNIFGIGHRLRIKMNSILSLIISKYTHFYKFLYNYFIIKVIFLNSFKHFNYM
jgi:hypothetical protein